MDIESQILARLGDATFLENLFRGDPVAFREAIPAVCARHPDSGILQAWQARLDFPVTPATPAATANPPASARTAFYLALATAVLVKLPSLLPSASQENFYLRYTAFLVLAPLAAYFCLVRRTRGRALRVLLAGFLLAAIFVAWMPVNVNQKWDRWGINAALLHLPLFLGWLTCLAYLGSAWREDSARAGLIRLIGEIVIYTALVLLAGILMTGITIGLFAAAGLFIGDFYSQWIVVMGAAAAPVVGAHLACQRTHAKIFVAPMLARLFNPLALLTLLVYLATVLPHVTKLYHDRDFLMVFNVMSVAVLAIAALSLTSWTARGWLDYVLTLLVTLALVVDLMALSAIVSRLSWYGFSPNRVAVFGANVLMSVHLAGLLYCLICGLRPGRSFAPAQHWLVRYLPAYPVWTAFVVFILPILGSRLA